MKKIILFLMSIAGIWACSDDKEVLVTLPNDVTFNEMQLNRFSWQIPEENYTARAARDNAITLNTVKHTDGSYSGFAYSNRNNRSFTWTGSQEALDTNRYSVYTRYPNANEVFAVASVRDDAAWFTLEKAAVIEHILVANTTYTYLALTYGNVFGTEDKPQINPNLPGGSGKKSIWYTYVEGGVKKMVDEDQDYFKLIVKGYRQGTETGQVEFYLCTRCGDPQNNTWSWVRDDWYKVDLSELGVVDKVTFELISTDIEATIGRMRTPAYFCLDGVRIAD